MCRTCPCYVCICGCSDDIMVQYGTYHEHGNQIIKMTCGGLHTLTHAPTTSACRVTLSRRMGCYKTPVNNNNDLIRSLKDYTPSVPYMPSIICNQYGPCPQNSSHVQGNFVTNFYLFRLINFFMGFLCSESSTPYLQF